VALRQVVTREHPRNAPQLDVALMSIDARVWVRS